MATTEPFNLSFIDREPNNWLPEIFSVVLSGKLVTGSPSDIEEWLATVTSAKHEGRQIATISDVEVVVSDELIMTLQKLLPPAPKPKTDLDLEKEKPEKRRQFVYQTLE